MPDIFLSYSRKDKDVVRRCAEALTQAGYDVWWDSAINAGEAFDLAIEAALKQAKAVVVLWSPASAASRWVRAEATLAQNRGTLLPVTIAPCDLPIMFQLTHAIDLSRWRGHPGDEAWRAFIAALDRVIAANGGAASPPTTLDLARGAAPALPDKPSVAVLPIVELGRSDDYFADAVTEEIATSLSQFHTLFVIAGASTLGYRGQAIEPARIARELGVRYLLEGSVRRSGERVRVSVKLLDGIVGQQVWADKFDDTMADVFALQDRIATSVAATIDSSMNAAEVTRSVARPSVDPDAVELYWRAEGAIRAMSPAAIRGAIALCEAAIAKDPRHAWSIGLSAFAHSYLVTNGWTDDLTGTRATALALADQALALAPGDVRVLCYCSGTIQGVGGSPQMAKQLIDSALELNPNSATALFWGGWSGIVSGDAQAALERFEAALRINPRSLMRALMFAGVGIATLFLGRYDEAAALLKESATLAPGFPSTGAALAAALAHAGRLSEAADVARRHQAQGGALGVLFMLQDEGQRDLVLSGLERARGYADAA